MASFQMPQFLESGDKIFANMNFRQFGWALGGFIVSFGLFSILQGIIPGIGFWALLPVAPLAGVFLFIAIGNYNGRSAEVYLGKFIEYFGKPKQLKYQRAPYVDDLDKLQSEWTKISIEKRWADTLNEKNALESNQFLAFDRLSSKQKAESIQELSKIVNQSKMNLVANLLKEEEVLNQKKSFQNYS